MRTEIELQKIEEPIKTALNEFLQWYDQHYTTPLNIEVDAYRLTIYIQHDITENLEDCIFECVRQTKRILNKEIDEEKIKESCNYECFVDVAAYINARFDDIRATLFKYLNKYGIKHVWWEEGWEDVYRYLVVYIQNQH
jgi:hypothetical protein